MPKTLHPVKWGIESASPSGFYAFGFGGGLGEAIRTDVFDTEAAALAQLCVELKKVDRCPDKSYCNTNSEKGRQHLAILNG